MRDVHHEKGRLEVSRELESLEARCLLSASSHMHSHGPVRVHPTEVHQTVVHHTAVHHRAGPVHIVRTAAPLLLNGHNRRHKRHARLAKPAGTSGPSGYTPARLRAAYGVDNIRFGAIAGDGAGQTIAIVDAYDDPTILADLATFDAAFGLAPPPSLRIVNQDGGSTLAAPDPTGGWALETALDVEWAHAMAPKANLLLVESSDDSFDNLIIGAVNYARHEPGVSAVSMSWGDSEWSTEHADYDSYLTTPAGHAPVTFLAATGDSGAPGIYPAYSPNVVAVGGTTLNTSAAGQYISEAGWSGSGGGVSAYEAQPAFQNQPGAVTRVSSFSATARTTPDISLAADPYSGGVSVVDSYDEGASTPWITVGGTSLSTPAWAALTAIANQGRALAGAQPLDGAADLLPRLYNLPATLFHDPTTGSNHHHAQVGYDLVTGIGTPVADQLVPRLATAGPFVMPAAQAIRSVTPVSSFDFHFSEAMDAASFSTSTGIAGFTGPGGVDLSGSISGFSWVDPMTLHVTFTAQAAAGSYAISLTSHVNSAAGTALDQNANFISGEAADGYTGSFTIATPGQVVNRAVFYNNSSYDGNDPAANAATDSAAIAPDKQALLPGNTASSANYTNYVRGINGIIIDMTGLATSALSAADFTFKAGATSDPTAWAAAPVPSAIAVFPGAGGGGADRVEITWPDAAIRNEWLQVTVNPSAYTTGLAAADVFYFGNLVGSTGNLPAGATKARVTIADILNMKAHNLQPAPVASWFDLDRDGTTTIGDILNAKANNLTSLPLVTV